MLLEEFFIRKRSLTCLDSHTNQDVCSRSRRSFVKVIEFPGETVFLESTANRERVGAAFRRSPFIENSLLCVSLEEASSVVFPPKEEKKRLIILSHQRSHSVSDEFLFITKLYKQRYKKKGYR